MGFELSFCCPLPLDEAVLHEKYGKCLLWYIHWFTEFDGAAATFEMFLVGGENWGCQIEHFCIGSKVNFLVVKQLISKRFITGAYVTELLEGKASFLTAVVSDVDFH